jgi:hypothetical protein
METSPTSSADPIPKHSRSRNIVWTLLHGVAFGLCLKLVADLLPGYQGPTWHKIGLVLLPWLLLGLSFRYLRRIIQEDELEKIISRDALAFAFYGLVFGLIFLGQLQSAGLVPDFKWHSGQLLLLLIFLMAGGVFWSGRRYR